MAILTTFSAYVSRWALAQEDERERQALLVDFPYNVVLEVAYPELDYTNRWCWEQFGPPDGDCILQRGSEYPVCMEQQPHRHKGSWAVKWLDKVDYNYGYAKWYFAREADARRFLEFVPSITWGEHFPK
jgi:hypothetical protein